MTAAQGFLRYCLTEPINEGDEFDELSATSSGKMDGDYLIAMSAGGLLRWNWKSKKGTI